MRPAESNHLNDTVKIREAREEDLLQIKQLVFNGFLEFFPTLWIGSIFPNAFFQVLSIFFNVNQ